MSFEIVNIDLENFIITNRKYSVSGKYLRSIDANQIYGSYITTEPLASPNKLVIYPSNPNSTFPIKTIYKVVGTNDINFPLDAKYDTVRNLIWIADAGNNRVLLINGTDFKFIAECKNVILPHSLYIDPNSGNCFVKSYISITEAVVNEIDQNGNIISFFRFGTEFPYGVLDIQRNTIWTDSLPRTNSISYDHNRFNLWWVDSHFIYMVNINTKTTSIYDLSVYGYTDNRSVTVDINSGNAFVISENVGGKSFVVQMNKYNSKFLGRSYIYVYHSSSSSFVQNSTSSESRSLSSISSKSSFSSDSSSTQSRSFSSFSSTSSIEQNSTSSVSSFSSTSSIEQNSTSSDSSPSFDSSKSSTSSKSSDSSKSSPSSDSSKSSKSSDSSKSSPSSDSSKSSTSSDSSKSSTSSDSSPSSNSSTSSTTSESSNESYELFAWGYNAQGELGINSVANQDFPFPVSDSANWSAIAAGQSHSLGVNSGNLYSCGYNNTGQLGNGSTIDTSSLVQIGSDSTWSDISGGLGHSLGINDGKLYAWGANGRGELGDETIIGKSSPVQIGSDVYWSNVSCGSEFSGGVNFGFLLTWGRNNNGQLGDGTIVSKSSPVQIGVDSNWSAISCGVYHAVAIKGGALYSWGYNGYGQLGLGDTNSRSSPVQIGSSLNWSAVSCSSNASYGINSGKLYSWGQNNSGELGLNDRVSRSSPVQVGSGSNWSSVNSQCNASHVVAITEGKLYAWGYGVDGQLGVGVAGIYRSSPVQVGSNANWLLAICGGYHTFGIKSSDSSSSSISSDSPDSASSSNSAMVLYAENLYQVIGENGFDLILE